MANSLYEVLLRGSVNEWNAFRQANPDIRPDLVDAHLEGASLQWANLCNTDLGGANLRNANLQDTNLTLANLSYSLHPPRIGKVDRQPSSADLSGADLTRAVLAETNLTDANLSGATLTGAYLVGTSLKSTKLRATDFTKSKLTRATFANVDLSSAKGLNSVYHHGPSTIGIDTLYASRGQIDEGFLRGAGVPDNLIHYAASLTGKSFEFYSCFISYSTKDQEFAERLHADLQANGVRCWYAPHDIAGGKKIHHQLDEAIRLHEKLLLILSPHSMNSNWVKTEIATARQRETVEKKQCLFPVSLTTFEVIRAWTCFDADIGIDSAREVREYFIPDFSTWTTDNNAYTRAFDQLLKGLQAGRDGEQ